MQTENKRIYVITIISAVVVILLAFVLHYFLHGREEGKTVKVGFIYVGDTSTGYTNNFVNAQNAVEKAYEDRVETISKFNVPEDEVEGSLQEMIDAGCNLIFTTSYGYGKIAKEYAAKYPDIQFCQATCTMPMKSRALPIIIPIWGRFTRADISVVLWLV